MAQSLKLQLDDVTEEVHDLVFGTPLTSLQSSHDDINKVRLKQSRRKTQAHAASTLESKINESTLLSPRMKKIIRLRQSNETSPLEDHPKLPTLNARPNQRVGSKMKF